MSSCLICKAPVAAPQAGPMEIRRSMHFVCVLSEMRNAQTRCTELSSLNLANTTKITDQLVKISALEAEVARLKLEAEQTRTNPIGTLISRESARMGPPRETMFRAAGNPQGPGFPQPAAKPVPVAPNPPPEPEKPRQDRFSLIEID